MDTAVTKVGMQGEDRSFFGHPRGLSTLFFTELWERFSYYGMRALLILFMTAAVTQGGLGFSVANAGAIYGLFTAMVYLLSLPGGWIADRLLGQRRTVLLGGILIAIGNFLLAAPSVVLFFAGLLVIAAGTGLLKPNISVIVGQLYEARDARRDAGFSIFYMGINLGAFLAPLACGYLGQRVNWRLGFALAGVGMTLGTIQYVTGWQHLRSAGLLLVREETPAERKRLLWRFWVLSATAAVLFAVMAAAVLTGFVSLTPRLVSDAFGAALLVAVGGVFAWLLFGGEWSPEERRRLMVVGVLFTASAVFWAVFEQAGSTLNLFAQRSVNKSMFGFQFPASWLQSLNALFIVSLAPVFAWLWVRLGRREPSSPAKFVLGLLGASAGFAILAEPASRADAGVLVSV